MALLPRVDPQAIHRLTEAKSGIGCRQRESERTLARRVNKPLDSLQSPLLFAVDPGLSLALSSPTNPINPDSFPFGMEDNEPNRALEGS